MERWGVIVSACGLLAAACSSQVGVDVTERTGQAASAVCSSAGLASNVAGNQAAAGTPVTWTATGGCDVTDTATYQFWQQPPGGSWSMVQDWSTSPTFNWNTTGDATGTYNFQVWARNHGSSASYEAYVGNPYALTAGGSSDGGAGDAGGSDASTSDGGASCGRFASGYTGSWSTVAANPFSYGMGMVGYLPAGGGATTYLLNEATAVMDAYTASTNTYSPLAGLVSAYYRGPAWSNGALWAADSGNLYKYTFANNTWTMAASGVLTANNAQTAADDSSNIWGYRTDGTLLEYSIGTGTVTTHTLPAALQNFADPRLTWDSCSGLLYLTNPTATAMYSYNPNTGVTTTLSGLPTAFGPGFCGDRSGHIFAFASTSSNLWKGVWQYTVTTATWALTPSGPTDSASSACGVGADGFLYATDPNVSSAMYRIKLQ
jgi:hypothetical protein